MIPTLLDVPELYTTLKNAFKSFKDLEKVGLKNNSDLTIPSSGTPCTISKAYRSVLNGEKFVIKEILFPYNKKIASKFEDHIESYFNSVRNKDQNVINCFGYNLDLEDDRVILTLLLENGQNILEKMHNENQEYFQAKDLQHITVQLIEALARLNQQNQYHLCLKPENIIYTGDGIYKLGDWCCRYDNRFRSPEYFGYHDYPPSGTHEQLIKFDVYTLGCLIIYMGLPPQKREILNEAIASLNNDKKSDELLKNAIDDFHAIQNNDSLRAIIESMICRNVDQRKTFQEICNLEAFQTLKNQQKQYGYI